MNRKSIELYPDYTSELEELKTNGLSLELLYRIIKKHYFNSRYNRKLYRRYMTLDDELPIFKRRPAFKEGNQINNRINNDFFSEIVDFKTGYFAGEPISYGYSKGAEAESVTGGEVAVDRATKAVTDFVTLNNMFGVDMETTKFASIYGYAGRLFYIDPNGDVRVTPVHGYETIILSSTDISEPEFAIRYYLVQEQNLVKKWVVEFYDNTEVYTFKGYLSKLELRFHIFQGI